MRLTALASAGSIILYEDDADFAFMIIIIRSHQSSSVNVAITVSDDNRVTATAAWDVLHK